MPAVGRGSPFWDLTRGGDCKVDLRKWKSQQLLRDGRDNMQVDPKPAGLSAERLERITEHLDRNYVSPGKITGCQTLIARHGHIAYFRSLGLADREHGTPMADDTIFRIYSMTKPLTSVALMMLWEQGRFQLNDPIEKVIPEWSNMKVYVSGEGEAMETREAARPMTFRTP